MERTCLSCDCDIDTCFRYRAKVKKDAIDFINLHSNKNSLVKQWRLYERVVTTKEIEL